METIPEYVGYSGVKRYSWQFINQKVITILSSFCVYISDYRTSSCAVSVVLAATSPAFEGEETEPQINYDSPKVTELVLISSHTTVYLFTSLSTLPDSELATQTKL